MSDVQHFKRCKFCKRIAITLKRQQITFPVVGAVRSKEPMCRGCANKVNRVVRLQTKQ